MPETSRPAAWDLRGVLNDVLSVSDGSVYMRHLKIDFETGDDLAIGSPHLFAPTVTLTITGAPYVLALRV